MRKQNILLVHNYYQVPGGEDTVVSNEKKLLEANGHKVIMYTRHNNEIKNIGIVRKLKLAIDTIFSFRTKKEIERIVISEKIDIVHVHNTLPLISPSVYWGAKQAGAKVVQTVHNYRLLCPGATFTCNGEICEKCVTDGLRCALKNKCYKNSRIQTLIVILMLKVNRKIGSYEKVDAYIALTEFQKEKLCSTICKAKIYVKPNFAERSNVDIVPIEDREYFMFLGRLDTLKGIKVLLETWMNIKNEQLIVVGTGPEEEWCKDYINKKNINNVKLVGFQNKEIAMELLSKAKALVVPSISYETFGMSIIEAYMLETPVIVNKIETLSTLVNECGSGLVIDVENYEVFSKALKRVKDLFSNMKKTKNKVLSLYSKDTNYKEMMEIYKVVSEN